MRNCAGKHAEHKKTGTYDFWVGNLKLPGGGRPALGKVAREIFAFFSRSRQFHMILLGSFGSRDPCASIAAKKTAHWRPSGASATKGARAVHVAAALCHAARLSGGVSPLWHAVRVIQPLVAYGMQETATQNARRGRSGEEGPTGAISTSPRQFRLGLALAPSKRVFARLPL